MSWTGDHEQAIAKAEMLLQVRRTPAALVAAASAFYAGTGACLVQVRRRPWRLYLLWRGLYWRHCALLRSAEAMQQVFEATVRGDEYPLTPDQVDVLCTIWYRFGSVRQRHWGVQLLEYVARWPDPHSVAPHTLAFIALHRVRYGLDSWSDTVHLLVLRSAHQVAHEARSGATDRLSGFGQAARVMRQLAMMLPKSDKRREQHLQVASVFAKEGEVSDQLEKLKNV